MTAQPGAVSLARDSLHDGWARRPHVIIDRLSLMTAAAELRVILCVLRTCGAPRTTSERNS